MARLAIVGSGIAGLGLAYYLRKDFQIDIYEKERRAGGHANTVHVAEQEKQIPIDTGFMVFNQITYPNLLRLFNELSVPIKTTDMSFSVQQTEENVEYAGASFNRLFGDRRNLFRPRHWKFLLEIDRFNKEAAEVYDEKMLQELSLKQYAMQRRYSSDFVNHYLIPMTGALWSAPPQKVLDFPAITLLRFFKNHGLLGQDTQFQWWTIDGGSKTYVDKLRAVLPNDVQTGCAAISVSRTKNSVLLNDSSGQTHEYDHVAFACHADEALRLIGDLRDEERQTLSAFAYQKNGTLLHTDSCIMPREKRCWASWNYRIDKAGSSTHYWMNSLQDVSKKQNYFVTLNGSHLIDSKKVIQDLEYHHPLFNLEALRAQEKLPGLNRNSYRQQYFFCGSYFGFGFHEDALRSSVNLAALLTGTAVCR